MLYLWVIVIDANPLSNINGRYIGLGYINDLVNSKIELFRPKTATMTHELTHHYINSGFDFGLKTNPGHWGFIQNCLG